jgi:hypothetical protein
MSSAHGNESEGGISGQGGMILIAAFVDPAYSDATDNAMIELKASSFLLGESQIREPEVPKIAVKKVYKTETEEVFESRCGIFNCCRKTVSVDSHTYFVGAKPVNKKAADKVAKDFVAKREEARKQLKEREMKEREKRSKIPIHNVSYDKVPEGILIYRLDTSDGSVTLLSRPHRLTDVHNLLRFMTVTSAEPSPDKSRRGILLTGTDGVVHKITACEQRTAVTWMEALNMMLRRNHSSLSVSGRKMTNHIRFCCRY